MYVYIHTRTFELASTTGLLTDAGTNAWLHLKSYSTWADGISGSPDFRRGERQTSAPRRVLEIFVAPPV